MKTLISDKDFFYDGTQLAPHWIYRTFGVMGDALVGFTGGADVSLDHMVDLEDVRKKAPIASARMWHFIGEWFIDSLREGILVQHLLVNEIYEELWERGITDLRRRGNDIYFRDRKFSVSIATKSPVSVLVHVAFNIETTGTPIATSGLSEMGIEPFAFAKNIVDKFTRDWEIWAAARVKVLPR